MSNIKQKFIKLMNIYIFPQYYWVLLNLDFFKITKQTDSTSFGLPVVRLVVRFHVNKIVYI